MLKSKTIFTISVLAAAISLTACQPKDKEPQTPATQTTAASEIETALKLVGDTENYNSNYLNAMAMLAQN